MSLTEYTEFTEKRKEKECGCKFLRGVKIFNHGFLCE